MHNWNNNYERGVGGPHIFMMIIMIGMCAVFAYALITYLRSTKRVSSGTATSQTVSAQTILNERLARGEISEDEFKSRSEALKSIIS